MGRQVITERRCVALVSWSGDANRFAGQLGWMSPIARSDAPGLAAIVGASAARSPPDILRDRTSPGPPDAPSALGGPPAGGGVPATAARDQALRKPSLWRRRPQGAFAP